MKKIFVFKIVFLALGTLLSGAYGYASDLKNQTTITFDFQSRQIQFFGVYAPTKSTRAGGLDAEIVARRNGIAHLSQYLSQSCGGAQVDSQKSTSPSWQGVVKSQGSEIFSNGVLKIALVAPVKDVLKETSGKKPQTLKSKDGAPLALKLPRMPASLIKCGLLNVVVGDRTVSLNPLSGSSDTSAKTVAFSLQGGTLRPSTPADVALLENSNLLNAELTSQGAQDSAQQATPSRGTQSSPTDGDSAAGSRP